MTLAPVTTAKKATAGGLVGFLSPLYVLVQSGAPIGWRPILSCAVLGALGYLGVWAPTNTEPVDPPPPAPVRRHRAED